MLLIDKDPELCPVRLSPITKSITTDAGIRARAAKPRERCHEQGIESSF